MNVRRIFTGLLWTLLASTAGPNLEAQATVKIVTPPNLPPATVGVRYTLTFQATGTTLPLSWDIDNSAAPPGFTIDDPTGILTGTPTVTGTYHFPVHVDALMGFENSVASDVETVTLVVSQPGSGQVTPSALTFSGLIGGENPPSKVLTVIATSGSPTFTFTVDSATQGSAAPPWLLAGPPQSQSTPGRIAVSVDLTKAPTSAGSYNARIRVAFAGATTTSDIPVTLILTTAPQQLSVSPTSLRFNKANLEQTILVRNSGGGGPIGIGAGAPGSNIISSVKLSAPQTPTLIHVTVKPTSPGAYRSSVSLGATTLLTGPSSAAVPVSYFVPPAGPFLAVDQTGYRFLVRQGNGTSVKKTIRVLNLGDPGTTINWKATLLAGSDFLSLGATSGTATPTQPGAIPLTVITAGAASKETKGYYGLIQITDSASPSTPQFVVVVLDVEPGSTPVAPDPISGGLFFAAVAQGPQPAVQTISVGVSSQSPVNVLAAASTSDGGTWLSLTPSSASASSASLAQFGVSIASGLKAGIYRGELDFAIGTELRVVNVTVVIAPAGTTLPTVSATESPADVPLVRLVSHAGSCTPTQLALTQIGMADNFSIPAGWPASLGMQLNDDCGSTVLNGTVVASFSNGDPPLTLLGDGTSGLYSATWQPGSTASPIAITLTAASSTLPAATFQFSGNVNPNATPAPSLVINGLLHNLNPQIGAPLAPGTVTQAYGTNLAAAGASPANVPLPTSFNGVQVLMGGLSAPIYYVSPNQLTIQVPSELAAPAEYQALISSNGGYTLPQPMDLVPVAPGVVAFPDGSLVAQHSDYSLVSSTSPAKPGETLTIYLVGMGATSVTVPSGAASPADPLAVVSNSAQVTIDGQTAQTVFTGLTPGGVGLYQINLTVPPTAKAGKLPVVITQAGVTTNATTLLVQP